MCYNGQKIFDEFKRNNGEDIKYIDDFGNLVYSIEKKYKLKRFDENYIVEKKKIFGNK